MAPIGFTIGSHPSGHWPDRHFPDRHWPKAPTRGIVMPLFIALYDRYLSSAFATKISELYNTQADSEAVFPYSVFSLVSDVPEWTFTEEFENCLIQFNTFSEQSSSQEVFDIVATMNAVYEFFDLVITGFVTVFFQKEVSNLLRVEHIWQHNVSYRILFQTSS